MPNRDIRCSVCGADGEIEAHETKGVIAPELIFRNLGLDRANGTIHYQCPRCGADLSVDTASILSGAPMVGRGHNYRYVPIVTGSVFIVGGLLLGIAVRSWWSILLGALCLAYGWHCLKLGVTASSKMIAEFTSPMKTSEETMREYKGLVWQSRRSKPE